MLLSNKLTVSIISIMLMTPAALLAKDSGYRFNHETKSCSGFNKRHIGECGDLTSYIFKGLLRQRLLKKGLRTYNLKGAKLKNLNLRNVNFSQVDLTGANLIGTDLREANVENALFHDAMIDHKTRLPLSLSDEQKQSMVNIDSSTEPTTTTPSNRSSDDIAEILFSHDTAEALAQLRSIASPSLRYHQALVTVLENSSRIEVERLLVLLDAVYYPHAKMQEIAKAMQETRNARERETLQKKYAEATKLAPYTLTLLRLGLDKVADLDAEGAAELLARLPRAQVYERAQAHVGVQILNKIIEGLFDLKNPTMQLLLANKTGEYGMGDFSSQFSMDYFKEQTDGTYANALALTAKLDASAKDYFLLGYIGETEKFTADELIDLSKASSGIKGKILADFLDKLSDINTRNIVKIMNAAQYSIKDQVALNYLESFATVLAVDELIALATNSYDKRNFLLTNFTNKLADFSKEDALKLASIATYSAKNTILVAYMSKTAEISSGELIALAAATYDQKITFLTGYLTKVSNWSVETAIELAKSATYSSKDTIILYFLDNQVENISTQDLIKLSQESYDKKLSILTNYSNKISDRNTNNTIRLASVASYSVKDTIILDYIQTQNLLTTQEIIELARASYDKKATILRDYSSKLSDFTVDNALKLAQLSSYSNKDTIILAYLQTASSIKSAQLLALARASYDKKTSILTNSLALVSDLTVDNTLTMAQELSYSSKDTFLLQAINLVIDLSTNNLMKLADASYMQKDQVMRQGLARLSN